MALTRPGVAPPRGVADDVTVTRRPSAPAFSRCLRRLRDERGITLIELLTSMAIMLIVITTITGIFVSGSNAEVDLRHRYQAQQDARLALERFRREVHNACTASVSSTTVSLTSKTTTAPFACTVQSSWSARLVSSGRYALHRCAAATCASAGTRWADYLTTNAVFTSVAATAGTLPKVGIDLTVDLRSSDTSRRYRLHDAVALRNYLRS
jgi:type II secretory pathway pseudopilin PulG